MKRLVWCFLCLCLAAEAAPSATQKQRGRVAASSKVAKAMAAPVVPAGPWEVDIQELVPALRPMGHKEREDQLRDWALYGLLMQWGLTADELARTTHQLAPMRLTYLEELFAFEYGRGRRAILSDERVLLLYEQSDPDPQATLGRLADRVRMETGRVPERFELYAFSADVDQGTLRVELRETVKGAALYTKEYGYHEAVVTDSQELGRWLGAVDDVVYVAQEKGGGLRLGGRRFEKSRTRAASLEDVATLYQAHSGLVAQRQQQVDQFNETMRQGDLEVKRSIPTVQEEVVRQFPTKSRAAQLEEINRRLNERWKQIQIDAHAAVRPVPEDPAFSLDPRIKGQEFATALKELADDPCRALDTLKRELGTATTRLESTRTGPGMAVSAKPLLELKVADVRTRCEALKKDPYRTRLRQVATAAQGLLTGVSEKAALAPLRDLRNELKTSKDETQVFLLNLLSFAESAHGEQCARYDGPLGGTRVGMNLFYTDLLGKLWSMDVEHTAPGMHVPGFISEARLPGTHFVDEAKTLTTTRVWFGPRKEAYSRSPDDAELLFQYVATRVFAAGSDPDHPEYMETAPADNSRRAVGWWERHYADVADYEQEYHLQNQIMKWSVITGFFHARGLAPYLGEVPVTRTAQFGQWYAKARSELRYTLPLQIGGEVGKECMDLLSTDSGISGGVALAGRKLDPIPKLKLTEHASLRHGLAAVPRSKEAAEQLGRAFPRLERPGVARVEPLRITRSRVEGVQVELGALELAHARAATGNYQLTLRTPHASAGDFFGTRAEGRVRLSWQPRELAQAPALAQRLTGSNDAIPVAVTRYTGKGAQDAPFQPWATRVSVPEIYDVLVPAASGPGYLRVRLAGGPTAHATPDELSSVLAPYKFQQLSIDHAASGLETSQGVVRRALKEGPGPGARKLHITGVDGFPDGLTVYAEKGTLFVARPSNARALQSWVELDRTAAFTQQDLNTILTAAMRGETRLSRAAISDARMEKAARALAGGDELRAKALLDDISRDLGPEAGGRAVQKSVVSAGDYQLTAGQSWDADRLYALAQDRFGELPPDALIRQTVARVHGGKAGPDALQGLVERLASKLSPDERMRVMKASLGLDDAPDITDMLRASLGFKGPIPSEVAARIHLVRDGPDAVSVLRLEKPLPVEPIPPKGLDTKTLEKATIYVEDGFSFNKNDFQASPAAHVAELGRNPNVQVVRIQQLESGSYRPGKVYEKKANAQGVVSEHAYRRVAGPRGEEEPGIRPPIYLIRHQHHDRCDPNKDGQVSEEERRTCKAA